MGESPDQSALHGPLLQTKLYVPMPRAGQVRRPELIDRLERGAAARLTLLSAPAGFGKTMLLAEWLSAPPTASRSVAWLALDPSDNHAASFWTYVVTALQTATRGDYSEVLAILRAPDASIEVALNSLLNELGATTRDVVLVLDDYHAIEAHEIHDGLVHLLERLPRHVHLVIATRADPPFPLARLRAQRELVEVRAAHLRFSPEEATDYLNEVMQLGLDAEQVAALAERTEGWIAALQLAALSMQGRADVGGFVERFAGDDRYVVDYLAEEVLRRQPDRVREFLLRTAILEQLSGPLCDAVTGEGDGKAMLELLDRGNLFLVPLDDRRQWYRYHHLFADMLRARLQDEQPEAIRELHRRAGTWHEQSGHLGDAIRHAFAAADFERAADLVERALPALRQGRQDATRREWLEALPDEVIRNRPVLSNEYAGALLQRGELEGVEQHLQDTERWLTSQASDTTSDTAPVVVDEGAARVLPSRIAVHRAGLALMLGDVAGTMTHARRALDLVVEDDDLVRGGAAGLLALAHWATGDLEVAYRSYMDAIPSLERAGHFSDAIGCRLAMFDVCVELGRLTEALSICEAGLHLANPPGGPPRRGASDMHIAIAEVLLERDDLRAAREHLQHATDLGDENGMPQSRYRLAVLQARIRQAEGDLDGALESLAEAERLYFGDFSPDVRPVAALRARLLVAADRAAEALAWTRGTRLRATDELSYLHEFEHITLARVLLATHPAPTDGARADALALLDRLSRAAEEGSRAGHLIEILVVQALALHATGDVPAALAALDRAISLAQPEGYSRCFIDEGGPMAALLTTAVTQGVGGRYASDLLAALGARPPGTITGSLPAGDALSDRELEVLRLLGTDLDGPGIARELVVSLNTLRTHTKKIYAKLGVNRRRAAVSRARELGLLSQPQTQSR